MKLIVRYNPKCEADTTTICDLYLEGPYISIKNVAIDKPFFRVISTLVYHPYHHTSLIHASTFMSILESLAMLHDTVKIKFATY